MSMDYSKEEGKAKNNVNTALAIVFIATAVVLVGGLIAVPILETAFADPGGQVKVTSCHIPHGNQDNDRTQTVGAPSVPAHVRNHGDTIVGECPPDLEP